jgi:hypothetical protein
VGESLAKLQDILHQLSDQLFRAWSVFLVAKHVDGARNREQVMSAHYFLAAIFAGCTESAILALSKLARPHKDSIHVEYLLNCCEHHPQLFPGVDKQEILRTVDEHRQQLERVKPLIDHVTIWRNRAVAHLDRKYINDPTSMASLPPIDMVKVEEAFVLLQGIINAYRGYLGASLIRLDEYEVEMAENWEYLMALMEKNSEAAA